MQVSTSCIHDVEKKVWAGYSRLPAFCFALFTFLFHLSQCLSIEDPLVHIVVVQPSKHSVPESDPHKTRPASRYPPPPPPATEPPSPTHPPSPKVAPLYPPSLPSPSWWQKARKSLQTNAPAGGSASWRWAPSPAPGTGPCRSSLGATRCATGRAFESHGSGALDP